jgi:hypothetical protein
LEGFNPGKNYFERNQKKKRGDSAAEIKGRLDAYLGGGKSQGPGRSNTTPRSTPFRIGPRI